MEQRTEDARRGRVTASIAGALLGHAPYMSPTDAFRSLVRSINGMPSEFKQNVSTEYGTFNESGALVEYQMETGSVAGAGVYDTHAGWLGCGPVNLVDSGGMVKVYCPYGKRDGEPFNNVRSMPNYIARLQVDMLCAGSDWCDFYQWSATRTKVERVIADPEWATEHLPSLHKAYIAAITADPAHYDGPKRVIIDTPIAAMMVNEYDEVGDAISQALQRQKEIIEKMAIEAKNRNAIFSGRMLSYDANGWGLS